MNGHFDAPGERAPGTQLIGDWVSPTAGLDDVKGEISCPYRDSNSDPSAVQPIASHYTDCANGTCRFAGFEVLTAATMNF
jgi:hypothetical protein